MKKPIHVYGISKTISQINNKKSKKEMEWLGDYDGNVANVQLHLNENGKTKDLKMKLDKSDLINLLSFPTNNAPLEKRLLQDFPFSTSLSPNIKKTKKTNVKTIRNSRSSKKGRKSLKQSS